MKNYSYADVMGCVGAVLEVKWDIHNPIEIRDLGDDLSALANHYDDFAKMSPEKPVRGGLEWRWL